MTKEQVKSQNLNDADDTTELHVFGNQSPNTFDVITDFEKRHLATGPEGENKRQASTPSQVTFRDALHTLGRNPSSEHAIVMTRTGSFTDSALRLCMRKYYAAENVMEVDRELIATARRLI